MEEAKAQTTQENVKEQKQEEPKIVEKVLTLNLRRYILRAPRFKRAKKAIKALRELLIRHSKARVVKMSVRLNQYIWSRGIKKPPAKVKVRIVKKEELAYADLAE